MFSLTAEEIIRVAHKNILRNRSTASFAGPLMLGKSEVLEDFPTACTDGRDKKYGRKFMESLTQKEATGVVLHEGGHVFLRHIPRHLDLIREDSQLANAAMDYAINDLIHNLPGYGSWFILPKDHLYDGKFRNWSVRQIFKFLKTGRQPEPNDSQPGAQGRNDPQTPERTKGDDGREQVKIGEKKYDLDGYDTHDTEGVANMSDDERAELEEKISQAIQEAAVLAGVTASDLPRALNELLTPERDWREVTQEFVQSAMRGKDEYTYQRFNRKRLVDELYRPSMYTEKLGKIVIANDTSGSISDHQMNVWMSWLSQLCDQCVPDEVRVLWWGSTVVGDQTLSGGYSNLREVLKPVGGGGTCASNIAGYINQHRIEADAVIVFTDGYTESVIEWPVSIPTLWIVTENEQFQPPSGRVVFFKE